MTQKSQKTRILETLNNVGSITAKDAQRRGIQNLRARICELRDDGVEIESVPYVNNANRVAARYTTA